MSLVRFALRQLVMKAITGKTFAQDRVTDSDITDLESAVSSTPRPIILIYTDDQRRKLQGKNLFDDSGSITLVLIVAIAGTQESTVDGGGTTVSIVFPATDPAREMQIDFIERQILMALSDPEDPWAGLYRKLVQSYSRWESLRGASTKEGTRFAARYIQFDVSTLNEPGSGAPLTTLPFWSDLVAAIEADPDPDFAGLGPILKALIESAPLRDYERAMQQLGLPDLQSAADLGLYLDPINGLVTPSGNPPQVDVIEVEDNDRGTTEDVGP